MRFFVTRFEARERGGMARISRLGRWAMRERKLRALTAEVAAAVQVFSFIKVHSIVYPTFRVRARMLSLGASRTQVDSGFESCRSVRRFLLELERIQEELFRTDGPGARVPEGKFLMRHL